MAMAKRQQQVKVPPHFKHQRASRVKLAAQPRVLDASDPGTGKTRVHAEDFAERRAKGGGCALIFAPKTALHTVWELDFGKFTKGMKVSLAYAANRAQAFAVDADAYVTNIDAATWVAKQPAKFFAKFDTLIIDEITYYKHHTSQRSRAMAKIVKHFPQFRRGLTGSFTTNGICDAWHPMFLIDDGKRLGRSFYQFRGAVCQPEQVGPRPEHVKWVDKPAAEATVGYLIRDIAIRHVFEECVDIPPNHQYERSFVLSPKHRKIYEQMKKDCIAIINNKEVTAINKAVLRTKLLQIASGAVYDGAGNYELVASDRYELATDLIEEVKHSVVFFQWVHQRDELMKEMKRRKLEFALIDGSVTRKGARDEVIDHFQKGFYDAVLVHPQSAAHAITLTKGTRTIWPSPTSNAEWWVQAYKRIYRIGQTQRTETIGVIAEDTYDVIAWESRGVKIEKMNDLNAYLKEAA